MNKIDELRNYADNLKIKLEVKNDTIKRYKSMVDRLTAENKKLNNTIQEYERYILSKINNRWRINKRCNRRNKGEINELCYN